MSGYIVWIEIEEDIGDDPETIEQEGPFRCKTLHEAQEAMMKAGEVLESLLP